MSSPRNTTARYNNGIQIDASARIIVVVQRGMPIRESDSDLPLWAEQGKISMTRRAGAAKGKELVING